MHRTAIQRGVLTLLALASVALGLPAAAAEAGPSASPRLPPTAPSAVPHTRPETRPSDDRIAHVLAGTARPLSDLGPLRRMIGDASIVGMGEATHGSHEFFRTKVRVFKELVRRDGFATFALEANWNAGVRLNDHVLHGTGDPRQIMREEFQNAYFIWNTQEYLDLIRWMRDHNVRHPQRPVHFMGNDSAYAGPHLFDLVTEYIGERHPGLLTEFTRLYRASRPPASASVDQTMKAYLAKPLAERRRLAADVQRALVLLERQRPGQDRERHSWAVQHARAVAQVGGMYAFDYAAPEGVAEMMRYRDRIMAENTVWWQRQTGRRVLLSAHNGHVAYESSNPAQYPKVQGAFLRDMIGDAYVNVGFTFGRGSFRALDLTDPAEPVRTFTVGPPEPGSAEVVLERVSRRNYSIDLRSAPSAARTWLNEARPVRSIGAGWPDPPQAVRLAPSYDVLIHLPRITPAHLL
ncbi:erythromycin esterase family protein [Streptomyces sp. NPDC005963]|uniref:erythromycin esterase family protein n=1 Tax=Streptomyces sp. NPDC005963 TaxID=3156721 RepID=UPI0033BFC523